MYTEYEGELTPMQLLRIFKRGLLKWVICVAAAFVVTFAVTFSLYCAKTTTEYTLTMKYAAAPSSPETELSAMVSLDNIAMALEEVGYTEDEISSKNLDEKISECLSASNDEATGIYTLRLSGKPLSWVSDVKYRAILNTIANIYAAQYGVINAYAVPSGVAETDVTDKDYIVAADYLSSSCAALSESVSEGLSYSSIAYYVDSATGYTFKDIYNMLDSLSSKINLFRVYVETNAAMKSGVSVSAKEYIYSKLTAAENAYAEAERNYNTLYTAYKQAKSSAKTGELVAELETASSELGKAETALKEWRNTWTAFGGAVTYNDDGSASYSSANFAGNYSTDAETILSETLTALKETYNIYNDVAARYNAKITGAGRVGISSYAAVTVTHELSANMVVIINIAVALFAFAAANTHTYAKMRKNGEFRMPEEELKVEN